MRYQKSKRFPRGRYSTFISNNNNKNNIKTTIIKSGKSKMYEKLHPSFIMTVHVNRQGTDLHDVHVIRHIIKDLHKFAYH